MKNAATVERRVLLILFWFALGLGFANYLAPASAQPIGGSGATYNRCLAVTPSDTVDLAPFTQSQLLTGVVYVGGAGNVVGVFSDGTAIPFNAAVAGFVVPIGVRRINATSTTATAIVACYRV